jgi:nucleoside-diphosphate-sugar epimerase/predicted dehydrogenase
MMATTKQHLAVGFLGAGYIADWHAAALRTVPEVSLAAVCDRDEVRARAFATRHSITHVYQSLASLLSDGHVDAIHVLLPPELHAQAAGQIIDAGVDVLLEKPMAIAAEECETLIERALSKGVKLGVSHNFLFAPIYDRLKHDMAAGRLGQLDAITITWNKGLGQLQSGPFNLWMLREPGNIILEVGSHSVAHMLDLVGPIEIAAVQVSNALDLPGGARFFRRWRIEAARGVIGVTLNLSFAPGFSEHIIHIRGSLAAATLDFERNTYVLHRHTAASLDFDRYHMSIAEANSLKSQARGTLVSTIYSKLRPRGGTPYGQSIARAVQSFYANPSSSIDTRLSPEFGRDVVRTCVAICQRVTSATATYQANSERKALPTVRSNARPEILVLGATGFIGQELARQLLDQGHSIRLLVRNPGRLPAELKDPRAEIFIGDLSQNSVLAPALEGIRCVYHLARPNVKTWEEWAEHETEATRRIALACLTANVDRFIYTGTIDSYYAGAGTITEETPLDPHIEWRNYYARAKAVSEQVLMELYHERGLPVVIFRPGIVIGRGSSPLHWGIGMWSHDAVCQLWGEGRTPLPLVLVDDVARALVTALTVPAIEGESFNLVARSDLSAQDYLDALEQCMGVEFQRLPTSIWKFYINDVAKWLVKRVIRHPDRRRPSFRDWESRTQRAFYDCSKARKVLGWNPTDARDEIIRRGIRGAVSNSFDGDPATGAELAASTSV